MPDASTLSDQEIGVAIVRLLGWTDIQYDAPMGEWCGVEPGNDPDDGTWVPDFASSIDAVKQAEEKLHAAGYRLMVESYPDGWTARWVGLTPNIEGDAEARARANAALPALLALAASTPAEPEEK
jgi:hypothetical protein